MIAVSGVVFDLEPRPDKSPLAYTDFLVRGRTSQQGWQRPVARVLGTYPAGGLFSLNELVHENGHAVHVSAIRTRPAYMDWPDTLFTEAARHDFLQAGSYLVIGAAAAATLRVVVPPWMFGSVSRMSPTFSSAPVAGMICITPMAPTWLFACWFSCDSW
mgnify:CR=1 FL=1